MKKGTLLHSEISAVIARMGHTDMLTICDCGLPIAESTKRIDLALCKGIPTFLETLDTVLNELEVEAILLAEEIKEFSPELLEEILERFPDQKVEFIPHEQFKERSKDSKAIIRTGEYTSYANIILFSGVTF